VFRLDLVALNRPWPFIFIGREVWTLVQVEIHEDLARFPISYSDSIIPDVQVAPEHPVGLSGAQIGDQQKVLEKVRKGLKLNEEKCFHPLILFSLT